MGALVITLLAKPVVLITFGTDYLPAVPALQIFIWYVPKFIFNIRGIQVLDSTNSQKFHILNEMVILSLTIVLNLIRIKPYGIAGAAAASVLGRFAGSVYLNVLARKVIRRLGL